MPSSRVCFAKRSPQLISSCTPNPSEKTSNRPFRFACSLEKRFADPYLLLAPPILIIFLKISVQDLFLSFLGSYKPDTSCFRVLLLFTPPAISFRIVKDLSDLCDKPPPSRKHFMRFSVSLIRDDPFPSFPRFPSDSLEIYSRPTCSFPQEFLLFPT